MSAFFGLWIVLSLVLMFLGAILNYNPTYTDETGEAVPFIPFVFAIPVFWGYYILCEYKFQKTLGKLLTKTKVVSETGDRPTLKQIVIRTLSRSIPLEYLSFLATSEGVHDRLSKTRVVEIEN